MKLEQLYKASFKGAEFFLKSAVTEGGRIIVYDKYPNSDNHSLQDLGSETETFVIEGLIAVEDDSYLIKRNALITALKSEGAGILSHPFYGELNVRLNRKFSRLENLSELGYAHFSIPFIIEPEQLFPAPAVAQNQSIISDKAVQVISDTETSFGKRFSVSSNSFTNTQAAQSKLTKLADTFNTAKSKAQNVAGNINKYEKKVLDFRNGITRLINTPAELASEITGLFNALNILATDPLGQMDMFNGFFNFGSDDEEIVPATAARIERLANQNVLNEIVKTSTLALSYENAALADYQTTDEIEEVKDTFEAQFISLEDEIEDLATLNSLTDVRKEARIFFDLESLQAYKVETIRAPKVPATILTYLYYGELDNWEGLLKLNKTKDPAFIGGDYKILTR